ncbi:MAG: hypothetical protein ACTHL8_16730 [Burkholderiaceae bacterium]
MRARPFLAIVAALAAVGAGAQPPAASGVGASHLDPGRPPLAARRAAAAEHAARAHVQSSSGSALDAEVMARLRESFDAADRAHAGTLTRAQAQAGGFGWLAQRFDAVDTAHAGKVSFADVQRYLRAQGAPYAGGAGR